MQQVATAREPIRPTWKMSDVLHRYPQLLDVLIDLHPAFSRLRNPILRRVQTRLVTVAQAAQIAGLEPSALVTQLNEAIGISVRSNDAPDQTPTDQPAERPDWVGSARVAMDLDVRPIIAQGEEPFSAIVAAAAAVPPGQMLRLRNSFEPAPLYNVLAKQGFQAWPHQLGPDDWEVFFLRTALSGHQPEASDSTSQAAAIPADAWDQPSATIEIDVSDLVPPEPMVRILSALEEMAPGRTLKVLHQRRPVFLYPRLDELGYLHETHDEGPGAVTILIHKPAAE